MHWGKILKQDFLINIPLLHPTIIQGMSQKYLKFSITLLIEVFIIIEPIIYPQYLMTSYS